MPEIDQLLAQLDNKTVRMALPLYQWDSFAKEIVAQRSRVEEHLRKPGSEVDLTFGSSDDFRRSGFKQLPIRLDTSGVAAMRGYLEGLPIIDDAETGGPHQGQQDSFARSKPHFASYSFDQAIRIPQLFDLLNYPPIVDFVERFMGCVPTIYSIRAWWSHPATSPEGLNSEFFHRDYDDWRFCSLFLYLNDVNETSGPHQIVEGSHSLSGMKSLIAHARSRGRDTQNFDALKSFSQHNGVDFSADCEKLFSDRITTANGPAGSMFLTNTIALHRGLFPTASPRLAIWARYGLGANSNSKEWKHTPPSWTQIATGVADTPRNRYINRLIVRD